MGSVSGDINTAPMVCVDSADLASRPIASKKSGDLAWLEDKAGTPEGQLFFLDRDSVLVVDGVGVLTALGGVGRWLSVKLYGSGTGMSVAELSDLTAIDDLALLEGAQVYVQTLRDAFFLFSGVIAPDGITILAALSGTQTWLRAGFASLSWSEQTTWYVNPDPLVGDDEAVGDVVAPIQTVAELSRRLRALKRGSTYTINCLGTIPSTDTLDMTGRVTVGTGARPILIFAGQRTVVRDGTISAANQSDPVAGATGTQASITDSIGTAWTPGEFVYFADGKACHVLKDLGAGVARVGHIFTAAATPAGFPTRSAAAPATPVDYDVVSMTVWNARAAWSGPIDVTFYNLSLAGIGSRVIAAYGNYQWLLTECIIPTTNAYSQLVGSTYLTYHGCLVGLSTADTSGGNRVAPGTVIGHSLTSFIRASLTSSLTVAVSAITYANCTFHGGAGNTLGYILCGSNTVSEAAILSGWIACYDWVAGFAAIQVQNSSKVSCLSDALLFGSGGAYAVRVKDGSEFVLPAAAAPRLQGATQDIDLDGLSGAAASATAPMPAPIPGAVSALSASEALNGANGAGWTAWAAAAPSFNRRVISHLTGAKIFSVA
jgi:hypothetical protein